MRLALIAAGLMAVLIVLGVIVWFRPFLTTPRQPIAEVTAPVGLFSASELTVPAGGEACMSSVTVDPKGHLAQFGLRPAKPTPRGGAPVELVVTAPAYRATLSVPGGYPGGSVTLPIAAPRRPEIGTACFLDRGRTAVLLLGTSEPRAVSRSPVEVDGRGVVGDIALSFLDEGSPSLLDRLGEVFGHASNLSDRLVPIWLVWIIAVLVALGVPCAVTFSFYRAVSEDTRSNRL